jgi:hypothetical protein
MTNLLLSNENLEKTIAAAQINQDQKEALLKSIPTLNEEERLKLLELLKETFFLDMEAAESVKKIKNSWEE